MNKIKNYFQEVKKVMRKITNKNKILVFIDILLCTIIYGASPNNYYSFNFFDIKHNLRKTFVTHRFSEKMIRKHNFKFDRKFIEDKIFFAKIFTEFFKREFIDMRSANEFDFNMFINNKSKIIIKPINSSQGNGIEVIDLEVVNGNIDIYNYVIDKHGRNTIVEDWIKQHNLINEIYPKAINPIRIITVFKNGKCNFLIATLTIGLNNEISNACRVGDMVAAIDLVTGITKNDAQDWDGNIFSHHPSTNTKIKGVQIPYWKELLDLVSKASKVIPSVKYIGWDVAIAQDGPVIIEGNTSPGYKYQQSKNQLDDGKGNKSIYKQFL